MNCPHCTIAFHDNPTHSAIGVAKGYEWKTEFAICPECKEAIIFVHGYRNVEADGKWVPRTLIRSMAYPKAVARKPLSADVTEPFASDYKEACLVLADSPKASAALSRRCLQALLRHKEKIRAGDLSKEIDEILKKGSLPSYLAEDIDAIRNIGNFAAHPTKDTHTGEIVDVEPGEAEWLLDILEGLFDFYFVQPKLQEERKKALNAKLASAGKPEMK